MSLKDTFSNFIEDIKYKMGKQYTDDEDYVDDEPEMAEEEPESAFEALGLNTSKTPKRFEYNNDSKNGRFTIVRNKSYDRREKTVDEKIMVFTPQSAEDVNLIADAVKESRIVVCNILDSSVSYETASRWLDYLVGVCYACDADVDTLTDNVFMLTPKGCRVSFEERNSMRRSNMKYASGYGR